MPLSIVTTGANWSLSTTLPTSAQLSATLGPSQGYTSGLVLVSVAASWSIAGAQLVQPRISAQRGAGGAAQDLAANLIVVGAAVTWNLRARLLAAAFTVTISADGFSALFSSTTGDAPEAFTWDFGDGSAGSGPTPAHIYAAPGLYVVTLKATRTRGFESASITSAASRSVTISLLAQPDESLDDVLNLEAGRHAYEPLRTQAADVGENVSFFNQVVNLPAGSLASLLFFTPAQTIRIRQVTATGSGDGLFRLILNGQVIDAKRSYATQRNIRFDLEEGIKLGPTDTLEVQVQNTSAAPQTFDGALVGRTL